MLDPDTRAPARRAVRFVIIACAAVFLLVGLAPHAEASHWRGGTIFHEVDETGKVTVTIESLWRKGATNTHSFWGFNYGNIGLRTGDYVDRVYDYDPPYHTTVRDKLTFYIDNPGQYSASNPYRQTLQWSSCCWVRGVKNIPESTMLVETTIHWEGPGTTNASPQLDSAINVVIPRTTRPEDQRDFTSNLNAIEPNGRGMSYTLVTDNGPGTPTHNIPGISIDSSTGEITIPAEEIRNLTTNSSNPMADWVYEVRVDSTGGTSAVRDVLLGIQETDNRAPEIDTGGDRTVNVGDTLEIEVTGTDPDGHSVTLSAAGLPDHASFTQSSGQTATGTLTFTPTDEQVGETISVQFTASDNGSPSLSTSGQVSISVRGANLPPVLGFIGNQTVYDITAGQSLTFVATADDPNPGDTLTFSTEFFRDDAQLDPSMTGLIDPATGEFSWTPGSGDVGVHRVRVRVDDDGVPQLFDAESVYVSVGPVNRSPAIDALPDRITVLEGHAIDPVLVRAVDPDEGDTVAITAPSLPSGATLTPLSTGRISESRFEWTPSAGQADTYTVTFAATDDGTPNLTERRSMDIVVAEPGGKPTITDISPSSVTKDGGHQVTIEGTNFDGEAIDVSFTGDFGTVTCSNAAVASDGLALTCTTPDMRWYTQSDDFLADVTVEVERTISGQLDTQEVTRREALRFKDPFPPVAHDVSVTVSEGSSRTFDLSVSNPDGGPLGYAVVRAPDKGAASVDGSKNQATYTPDPDFFGGALPDSGHGTDSFDYQVCTQQAGCDTGTVTTTVIAVNQPPTASDVDGGQVISGQQLAIQLDAVDRETPGSVSYAIDSQPGPGLVQISGDTATYYAPGVGGHLGTVTFTYVATDADGLTSPPATVTIEVIPPNDPPTAALAFPDGSTVPSQTSLALDASGSVDSDGTIVTYRFWCSSQAGYTDRSKASHTCAYDTAGGYTVALQVLDDDGDWSPTITAPVTVTNQAPELSLAEAQGVDEDTVLTIASLGEVTDPDSMGSALEVTLSAKHGGLTLGTTSGLSGVQGNGSKTVRFLGSVSGIAAALSGVTYRPDKHFNGGDAIAVSVDDRGNTGGTARQDAGEVPVTVHPVNDPPVWTAPASAAVDEDDTVTVEGLSVADLDAAEGTGEVQVALSVDRGTLSVDLTGLQLVSGGVGTDSLVARGPLATVNARLGSVTYRPDDHVHGSDALQLVVDDLGNTGDAALQDTAVVDLPVQAINDPPTVTVPGPQTVDEDTPLSLSLSVHDLDVDEGDGELRVDLSVQHGTLSIPTAGLAVEDGGSGQPALTLRGDRATLNSALAAVTYQGEADYNGDDLVSITVDDRGNHGLGGPLSASGSVAITVLPVNDAPALDLPGLQSGDEDQPVALEPLGVSDRDADEGTGELRVDLSVDQGTLDSGTRAATVVGGGWGQSSVSVRGSATALQDTLSDLVYTGDADTNGQDVLTVQVDDLGNHGSGGAQTDAGTVDISVQPINDAPTVAVPGPQSVDEDTDLSLPAVDLADTDAAEASGEVEVEIAVLQGTLSLASTSDLQATGDGSDTVTLRGAIPALRAALAGITYRGDAHYNGADTLTATVDDLGNAGVGGPLTAADTVAITVLPVDDAPTVAVPGPQSVDEDTDLALPALVAADIDAHEGDGRVEATLSVDHGTVAFAGDTGRSVTATGTLGQINEALAGVVYRGNAHFNGDDTLSVTIDDLGNTGAGGPLTVTDTVPIAVQGINDAPVLTLPGAQSVDEDVDLALTGLSVRDLDAEDHPLRLDLSVDHGTLSLATTTGLTFVDGTADGAARLAVTGSQAALRAALATVRYRGDAHYNGPDTLSVAVDDQGHVGAPAALGDEGTVAITVDPVNDAPVLTVPGSRTVAEDAVLTPVVLSVADLDADEGAGRLQVALSVDHGTLSLPTGSLDVTAGGPDQPAIAVQGSLADLNAALAQVTYQGDLHHNGADTLTVVADDLGNEGSGGPLTDTGTVDLSLYAVNDAPVVTAPGVQHADEDLDHPVSGVSVADLDAGEEPVRVDLTAEHGTLSLGQTGGLSFVVGDGSGDATLSFTAPLEAANAALATLVYRGDLHHTGADTLRVFVDDLGNTGTPGALQDQAVIPVTVHEINDPPVVAVPEAQQIAEDGALEVPDLGVSDVDAEGGWIEVTLSAEHGLLSTASDAVEIEGDETAELILTGPLDDLQAALDAVTYRPLEDWHGTDTLTVHADDLGFWGAGGPLTDTAEVPVEVVPVNDPPVVDLDGAGLELSTWAVHVEDEGPVAVWPDATITDRDDSGLQAVTVTLANPLDGASEVLAVDTTDTSLSAEVDGATLTLTGAGRVEDYAAVLASLTYENTSQDPSTEDRRLEVVPHDGTDAGAMGVGHLAVEAVNDAPVFVSPTPSGTLAAGEGTPLAFTVDAEDVDDPPPALAIEGLPEGADFDPTTGAFAWTPTWEDAGTHPMTLVAADDEYDVTRTITVEVVFVDADGDGVSDTLEESLGLDPESDDSDGDGIVDVDEMGDDPMSPVDTDGDGTIDALDTDSDNDGIPDAEEAGDDDPDTPPVDTDGDGIPDFQDPDSDGDGILDHLDNCRIDVNEDQIDTDGDGQGDACDADDDGDGLSDEDEALVGTDPLDPDTDGDLIIDGDEVADALAPDDSDGDGEPDVHELDSDDDGIPDDVEAGDLDPWTPPVDTDGDGIPDFQDPDSDDDGILDVEDNCRIVVNPSQTDVDGDGEGDVCDDDYDGDHVLNDDDNCPGIPNADQADLDGDGEGDACDADDDGDSVADPLDNCPQTPNPAQLDGDGDGKGDACDAVDDFEMDIAGGGGRCNTTGAPPGGAAPLLLLAVLPFLRRRRPC